MVGQGVMGGAGCCIGTDSRASAAAEDPIPATAAQRRSSMIALHRKLSSELRASVAYELGPQWQSLGNLLL